MGPSEAASEGGVRDTPSGGAPDAPGGAPDAPVDVLIVAALSDELDALLAQAGGPAAWRRRADRVHVCALPTDAGPPLIVAAAWTGAMGAAAAASRAAALVEKLRPACLAMCGICAGKRGDVALGDVIVADRVYAFDHGKLVAPLEPGGAPELFHDLTTYNLERAWRHDAEAFVRDLMWAAPLLPDRPPTKEAQARWLLRTLDAHEREGGSAPLAHPEHAAMFRLDAPGAADWADRVRELRARGLLASGPGVLHLTDAGRLEVAEERLLHPRGAPPAPPFRVHIGPIATGNAVIEDPQIFDRLKRIGRKTLGVEMEAYAIGLVGDALPRRAIVAKGVSDHADGEKDDRFRAFACRASAAWLLAFLRRHLEPRVAAPAEARGGASATPRGGAPADELPPRSPFPDLFGRERRQAREGRAPGDAAGDGPAMAMDDLHRRVERALAARHPGARLAWKRGPGDAPAPLRAFLEVAPPGRGYTRVYPVAVIEGAVDAAMIDAVAEHLAGPYRHDVPFIQPLLVHAGPAPGPDALDRAHVLGVRLESLLELGGSLDLRPYVEAQTRALEADPVYPSRLFVPQRISYRIGLDERRAEDALDALDAWLGGEGPQLALVLGDFGSGKTFLLRELALRLGRRPGAIVPILVELRKLEKARSLDALLGQHFIPERGMRRFDHDAFRAMLEEGRVALLFDGFDELALRATYDTAGEHLEALLQAAIGKAKVVIASRTQHFIDDQQSLRALGDRATQRGFRMLRLLPFDEPRIRRFLEQRFAEEPAGGPATARRWYELLGEVRDLRGLSQNPRMLGFIADLSEEDLRHAAEGGALTPAALYRALLRRWLGHETERDHPPGLPAGLSAMQRWEAATRLAALLWRRRERTIAIPDIPPELLDAVARLAERPLSRDAVAFKVGTGTLLGRDEAGRFSFVHLSVLEWLVANAAATDVRAGRPSELLAAAEASDLLVDFLCGLAGTARARGWATAVLAARDPDPAAANAHRILRRLGFGVPPAPPSAAGVDLPGHDLRGRDLSGTRHLRGANLERGDLSEASLVRAELARAQLADAHLRGANLERAGLEGADLRGADLSFARLLSADLSGARLDGARLRYARLVGARIEPSMLRGADTFGAALPRPGGYDIVAGIPLGPCGAVAWSPDGALLATGHRHGTVVLWDANGSGALRALDGHAAWINALAFSPDGRLLASGSDDHTVRLWRTETGALVRELRGHGSWVRTVAFSPDGALLASGAYGDTLRLWSVPDGRLAGSLEGHSGAVKGVAFSPDGALLASASNDRTVRLWSPASGQLVRALSGHEDWVNGVAFSPDGALLASVSDDRTVRLWRPATGAHLATLEGHTAAAKAVAFSPDGSLVASGAEDRTVRLWSPASGQLARTLDGHSDWVRSIAFSPDSALLASGSEDGAIRMWRPGTGHLVRSLQGHASWVHSVAFSPDGRLLASGSYDRTVRVWSPATGKLLRGLEGAALAFRCLAFSPDGRFLGAGSDDKSIALWSAETGERVASLERHTRAVDCLAFSPDGQLLASGSSDRTIRLWHLDPAKHLGALRGHADWIRCLAFSPDGSLLASGAEDRTVWLWHVSAAKRLRALEGHTGCVRGLAFSPDGALLATAAEDRLVRLWRPATGELVRVLEGHARGVTSVAFSPDGSLLASGSEDGTLRLWSPAGGALLRSLDDHRNAVRSVSFAASGRLLASCSHDRTIRLWSIPAALRGAPSCLAVLVPGRRGWAAYTPDGRYKLGGDAPGLLGFTVGLCRFEPGELDAYPDAFDHPPRRIPEDEPLYRLEG